MPAAIHTEKLGKTYLTGFWMRPFLGLEDLSLEVPEGATFGFVGPNGAGKTTTIKILMGLQSATSGKAWIHGVPVPDPASRKKVGFLPERPYFYEYLTAYEFLAFYANLSELPTAGRDARIRTLLERVELARFSDIPLGKFSKGMMQRAGLAQAMIADPEMLILDEPMSGLDPMGRVLVRDIILEEKKRGKTVFFSSHILSDIEAICDRVAIVVGGRLRGQGTLAELVGDTVEWVDCRVDYPGDLPGLQQREGSRAELRLPPEDVERVLDQVRSGGGRIISVVPKQKTLEQVLLTEVEQARPMESRRMGVLT